MTTRMHGGRQVVFAFDAALDAARGLWALSDAVARTGAVRDGAAQDALVGFAGPVAVLFAARSDSEAHEVDRVVRALRSDAQELARAWAAATDEENRVRRAERVTELKDRRSFIERLGDVLTGFDEWPGEVPPVPVPIPPMFLPTADLVRYPG